MIKEGRKMFKKLNGRKLLLVLLIGEIITTCAGIIIHMSTKETAYMIIGFFGIWIVSALVSASTGGAAKEW